MPASMARIMSVVALSVLKIVFAGGISALTYRHCVRNGAFQSQTFLKEVSIVNRDLLTPLFIFSRCARGITSSLLLDLAFVPVVSIMFLISGLLIGTVAAAASRAPRALWPIGITVCTFSNVLGLPLPLLTSLIEGLYADDPDAHMKGPSYLFLCNSVNSTIMWVIAPRLLSLGGSSEQPQSKMLSSTTERSEMTVATEWRSDASGAVTSVAPPSHPTAPLEDATAPASSTSGGGRQARSSFLSSHLSYLVRFLSTLHRPVWASIFGVLVGATPLRSLLVVRDAPLRCVLDHRLYSDAPTPHSKSGFLARTLAIYPKPRL